MGNSQSLRSSADENNKPDGTPKVKKLEIKNIDPRSPTEGIMRTPIVLDKLSRNENFNPLAARLPFDTSTFESIDGCLTEDDSIHLLESPTVHSANTSLVGDKVHKKKDILECLRRSLRVHSGINSSGLLIQMRRKQKAQLESQQVVQANLSGDSPCNKNPSVPLRATIDSESAGPIEK